MRRLAAWLREVGETLPADPEDDRCELPSGDGLLITSDPILVALALNASWHENGHPQPINVPLPIPSWADAVEIVRSRPILNDFNTKRAGTLPGLLLRAKAGDIEDL